MVGVVPAHQRLGAARPAGRQRDQRLVVDLHLAPVHHMVQRRVQIETLQGARTHAVRVEQSELAPAATLLGPVHRHVCIVEEVVT